MAFSTHTGDIIECLAVNLGKMETVPSEGGSIYTVSEEGGPVLLLLIFLNKTRNLSLSYFIHYANNNNKKHALDLIQPSNLQLTSSLKE